MNMKHFKGVELYEYLHYQITSAYNKSHVYYLLNDYNLKMFYYNVAKGFERRLLSLSIEQLTSII